MFNHFYRAQARRRSILFLGVGVLLLLSLLVLPTGKAFAFNGQIVWSGWGQVQRPEPPGAPGPVPTADTPNSANYVVTIQPPPGCTDLCIPTQQVTQFLFVREGDNTVNYTTRTSPGLAAGWNALQAVPGGGVIQGSPSAIQFGNTLYVFAQGTNNNLYMTSYNGSWLGHWTHIAIGSNFIPLASSPNAMVYQNQLFVFVRESDSTLKYYTSTNGSSFIEHTVPGGGLTPSSPTSATDGTTLYLFVQGTGTNSVVWVQTLKGTTWASVSWQPVVDANNNNIPTVSSPGVAEGVDIADNDTIDLFARQGDNSVQWFDENSADGIHWKGEGEVPTGGRLLGSPFALSDTAGSPSLFVEGTDGNVWENDHKVVLG